MTIYNWHSIDKIKDLVRLPKHADVLVLIVFYIAVFALVCYL